MRFVPQPSLVDSGGCFVRTLTPAEAEQLVEQGLADPRGSKSRWHWVMLRPEATPDKLAAVRDRLPKPAPMVHCHETETNIAGVWEHRDVETGWRL